MFEICNDPKYNTQRPSQIILNPNPAPKSLLYNKMTATTKHLNKLFQPQSSNLTRELDTIQEVNYQDHVVTEGKIPSYFLSTS